MNLNTQFVFEAKTKRNLTIGMVLGLVCLVLSFLYDDAYHTRFWTNYLHNAVFFTGIAFTVFFFLCANITAFAGWMVGFKRVWEAMGQFMWVGLILLSVIVIGVWGHLHHLYHWNTPGITDPTNPLYDRILAGKASFLNPVFFTVGVLGFLGLWYFWAFKLRQVSVEEDGAAGPTVSFYKKQRKWAASFLPIGGFLSAFFLWQLVMSIDSHWYSTMFAWYSTISLLVSGIALTIMLILFLKSRGYMENVSREHLHDLGKFLFGLSVFWTYLWFDQFMLIWYANVGEETIYYKTRMTHYPVLFWGNLLMNFIAPFFILMRNDTKRKMGTIFIAAAICFFGHWWDFFYMIKPGARIAAHEAMEISHGGHGKHQEAAPISQAAPVGEKASADHSAGDHSAVAEASAGHGDAHGGEAHGEEAHGETGHGDSIHPFQLGFTIPGLTELGVMIGFLSLFLFFFFTQLQKASLLPKNDPFIEESMHHHTGVYPAGEEGGDHH